MRNRLLLIAALVVFAFTTMGRHLPQSAHAEVNRPAIKVSIAVPERGAVVVTDDRSHFSVVIENVSDQPQKIIDEWNSWGYFSLRLEFPNDTGEKRVMEKQGREWSKNFLTTTVLKPGQVLVRDVYLDKSIWTELPVPEKGDAKVKISATFVQEDKNADAWHGRVTSPEQEITFRNLRP